MSLYKYSKYKEKYINLKYQVGGNSIDIETFVSTFPKNMQMRIHAECQLLQTKFDNDITLSYENDEASIFLKSGEVKIILPLNYPFNKPFIFINNNQVNSSISAIPDWTSTDKLYDYLLKYIE